MRRQAFLFFLCGALLLLPAACSPASQPASAGQSGSSALQASESQSKDLFAMDTVMTLTAYGSSADSALEAAEAEIQRLDALFSISSDGDIGKINQTGSATVSEDTAVVLTRALQISADTGGIFDCTIAPVVELWGFTTGDYHVPETETLQALLAQVDYTAVSIDGSTVSVPEGVQVDLGGIAKGFTSDRVMQIFEENGVTSGIISLGGNVQTLGRKPDGSLWRIAIQDPTDTNEMLAVLEIEDEAVITSGGYERYFEADGVRYHHIIDPRTGYPAESGLLSVTIVSADGTLADGLSTSLFIMGAEPAADYWRAHRDEFQVVLAADDGTVYISEGLENRCSVLNGGTPVILR